MLPSPHLLLYTAALLLYVLLRPAYTRIIKKILALTNTDIDDKIYEAVEEPLWLSILLFLLYLLLHEAFPNTLLLNTALTGTVLLLALALIKGGKILLSYVIGSLDIVKEERVKKTISSVLTNIYIAVVGFFALLYTLSVWGIDITPLMASAGIVGIVVGLALKDPLENLVSGLLLLTDPPFRVGDIVKINGIAGEVKEIGLRNTKILTFDGDLIVMPNSSVIKSTVENLHLPTNLVRTVIKVSVSYDSDPEKVKKILLEIASSDERILREPAPQVFFTEMGDFALTFELRYWTKLPHRLPVLDRVNTAIIKRFREEGIEIPYPITTVYLRREEASPQRPP